MNLFRKGREALFGGGSQKSPEDARNPGIGESVGDLLNASQPVTPAMLLEAMNVYNGIIRRELSRISKSLETITTNSEALGVPTEQVILANRILTSMRTTLSVGSDRLSTRVPQPPTEVLVAEANSMRQRLEKLQAITIDVSTVNDLGKIGQLMIDILG